MLEKGQIVSNPKLNMKQHLEQLGFTDANAILGLNQPGVYALGYYNEIVYVGQSMIVSTRICRHVEEKQFNFNSVFFLPVRPVDLLSVESFFILKFNPKHNIMSPFSPNHNPHIKRAKVGLQGIYNRAERRRLDAILEHMALNSYELESEIRDNFCWSEEE